jgi:hypothetical protein
VQSAVGSYDMRSSSTVPDNQLLLSVPLMNKIIVKNLLLSTFVNLKDFEDNLMTVYPLCIFCVSESVHY